MNTQSIVRLFSLMIWAGLAVIYTLVTRATSPPDLALTKDINTYAQTFTSCAEIVGTHEDECETLVALYQSTDGDHWTNHAGWLVDNNPCTWYGITCDDREVRRIVLPANNLQGPLPGTLGNLYFLNALILPDNHLRDQLPAVLGQLTHLDEIQLSGNQFSGAIPPEWNNLSILEVLGLANNQLRGNIPSLCNLPAESADFGYNGFSTAASCIAEKDPDWADTQTGPPTNVQAQAISPTTVELTWTPIRYQADSGYYTIWQMTPAQMMGQTADKSIASFKINNLTPGTSYSFVVRAFTPRHGNQQNDLTSDDSAVVTVTTDTGESDMITQIVVDKPQICAGDNVLVTVAAQHPTSPQGVVDIAINGRWGSPQYLQFTGSAGVRLIQVTAATPEKYSDTQQKTIEVIECPAQEYPVVTLRPNPFHEHTVDFVVANGATFSSQNPVYHWEFGDGQFVQTTVPYVAHFYGSALLRDQLYTNFQTTLTVQRAGLADIVTHKTVTLWNQYAFNKQRGFIQPPVVSDQRLQPAGSNWVGHYTINNLEDTTIQFTARQLEYQFCDPDRNSLPQPLETILLEVGGRQQVEQQLEFAASALAPDVCGVAVTLIGQAAQSEPVYTSFYFDVQANPLLIEPVNDPNLQQLLNQIAAQQMVADPYHITDDDLYRLASEGKITFPLPPSSTTMAVAAKADTNTETANEIGQPCRPGDPSPRPGLTCQTTGAWTIAPPRIANARKGDVILSAGCGLVGGLLRQVSPPQRYSHTGIMTRDYYQVRHSTAAIDRYQDYPVGVLSKPSDGIRPDVLRYGWPGVITQSIDEAYNGQYWLDPENGKAYLIEGFSADPVRCGNDIEVAYPVVIKPVPGSDPAVRERLRAAADLALTIDGHYRFYLFSNAAVIDNRSYDAPPDAGWAVGRRATVCSAFVWHTLKLAGIGLEGAQLEQADILLGAERDLATPDGLYLYTEAERKAGVYWLYAHTYDLAYEKSGWVGRLFTDAPDDIANQMTNCFSRDGCDTSDKDSDRWKNPGIGRAVSPENIFFWDAPATGGVYGYSEPLVYRSGEYVPAMVWKANVGVGAIAGRVFAQGKPVVNASVTIAGLELFTDDKGEFHDNLIPQGSYELVASAFINGALLSTRSEVVVISEATTRLDLILQEPPDYYRRVTIQGSMFIVDDEIGSNETKTVNIFESAAIDPFNRRKDIHLEQCVGGEVRVELDFHLQLKDDNKTVDITGEAKLYEGTSCHSNDREDRKVFTISLLADAANSQSIRLRNSGIGGGDKADIDFSILNGRQTRSAATAVTPTRGATLVTQDQSVSLTFPPKAVHTPVTINYSSQPTPTRSLAPGQLVVQSFALAAYTDDNVAVTQFDQPYTLVMSYTDGLLAAQGIDEASVRPLFFNGEQWANILPCTGCGIDMMTNQVTAVLDHFTEFVLVGDAPAIRVFLPIINR